MGSSSNCAAKNHFSNKSERWHRCSLLYGGAPRPNDKISNEVSVTPGYEFNKNNSVTAASGKNKFKFDIKEQGFAWIADNKIELKMIKQMRKGSRIMITGYNQQGSQTIDHYSLLGFTKAYNASRKACS